MSEYTNATDNNCLNNSNYNIMIIGFMGVGKTTVSKELSKELNMPEVDMDAYIVEHEGKTIAKIFEEVMEEGFRKIETQCLKEIQMVKGRIVSCGGGAVLKDENVKCMKESGVILLLTATPETVYIRVKDNNDRPILNGNMNVPFIEELMNKRKDRYNEVADIIVETDNKSVYEICEEIKHKLDEFVKFHHI